MLRETLKPEIDTTSETQFVKLAELLRIVKTQTQKLAEALPFWQRATPAENAQDFQNWVAQLTARHALLQNEDGAARCFAR